MSRRVAPARSLSSGNSQPTRSAGATAGYPVRLCRNRRLWPDPHSRTNQNRRSAVDARHYGFLQSIRSSADRARDVRRRSAQNLRELAREQAKRNPGEPLLQPASPAHYEPKTIEKLTREASVVVQTTLVQTRSYLGPQADRVLTDYSMVTPKFLVGRAPVLTPSRPGMVPALILTTFGGEVVLDGVTVRGTDTNREPITSGAQYLLFLMPSRAGQAGHMKSTTVGYLRSPVATHERSSEKGTVCSRTPRMRPCRPYSTGSSPRHRFAEHVGRAVPERLPWAFSAARRQG